MEILFFKAHEVPSFDDEGVAGDSVVDLVASTMSFAVVVLVVNKPQNSKPQNRPGSPNSDQAL